MTQASPRTDLPAALERIHAAAARIEPYVRHTPTVYSYTFSESAGCDVFLKLESLQRTGSFKVRGALAKLLDLPPEQRGRGLVAASAGNHAQGVALAARVCEVPATIVMPVSTAVIKVQRTEGYGAEVVLHGRNYDEAQERAHELARELDRILVHPFDDPALIEGQATVGLEILDQVDELDTIVAPVGGGGLVAGIATAVKARKPSVRVVGVQAEGACPMALSFRRGERVRVDDPTTIAEGIRVGGTGEVTFERIRELVDDVVTVTDEELTDAMLQTMEKSKVVAEAAGVAGVAALAAGKLPDARKVCAVVSGGNIDLNLLARIIESGLAHAGRYHHVRLRLPDEPGVLVGVLRVLAETRVNVLDVEHHRAGWKVPVGFVDVEVLVETRRPGEGGEVDAALRAAGYEPLRG